MTEFETFVEKQERNRRPWLFRSASVCGICGRGLTDPLSVAKGIGPVCVKHMGPSFHPSGSPQSAHAGGKGQRVRSKITWDPKDLPPQWTTSMHDKDGLIKPDAIKKAVAKAVKERPSRAMHGYTATNAFFIVNGRIVPWNEHSKLSAKAKTQAIPVHSHGGENWKEYVNRVGKLEEFQPHNSEDIYLWIKGIKKKTMTTASALIMGDGRMEILEILPSTDPAMFKLGRKRLEKLVQVTYNEVGAMREKDPKLTTVGITRDRVRDFAKKYGLRYTENVPWRMTPELKRYGK